MKFRKKPVVIDAIQWTGNNLNEIREFTNDPFAGKWTTTRIGITTLEGIMEASLNDWIIKGVKGEFYPCKPDIFKETYDQV